jgi:hopanoid-associated phosphorylase
MSAIVAVSGLASEARIAAGAGVRTIVVAEGGSTLAAALEDAIADGGVRGVISFGIAGGLADGVAAGSCIVGRAIVAGDVRWSCDAAWASALLARLPAAMAADLAGVDAPVMDARSKRALRLATGADAVDTESHIAAEIAARHRLPFAALRVVADSARRGLPPVAAIAVAPDGTVKRAAALRSLARRPGQLPSVISTGLDARRALRALSGCRRLLGPGLGFPDLAELPLDVR